MASARTQVVEEPGTIVPVRIWRSGVRVLIVATALNDWYETDKWSSRVTKEQRLQDESFPE
jgi:hypothetical protein